MLSRGLNRSWSITENPEIWVPLVLLGIFFAVSSDFQSSEEGVSRMLIRLVTLIGLLFGVQDLQASEWGDTERRARGQTVYFYAWGRSPSINILLAVGRDC